MAEQTSVMVDTFETGRANKSFDDIVVRTSIYPDGIIETLDLSSLFIKTPPNMDTSVLNVFHGRKPARLKSLKNT